MALIAGTALLAVASFLLASRYFLPAHVIVVLFFWFAAVPVLAYYVAFRFNLRKHSASALTLAGVAVFFACVMGITYHFAGSRYFQIMAVSFLPAIITVYYVQQVVKRIFGEDEHEDFHPHAGPSH